VPTFDSYIQRYLVGAAHPTMAIAFVVHLFLWGAAKKVILSGSKLKERPAIETERLLIRPFELSDAKDVQCLAGDRAIANTTLNITHPYEDGMAEEWISAHQPMFEAGELSNFAIVLKTTDRLIGAIGLSIVPRFERAELKYWIGRPYWKNGYCTEPGRAVIRYGFSVLNLNRIHA